MNQPLLLRPGDTFWSIDKRHLWVALTTPDSNGNVIVVNLTSHYPDTKTSCDEHCTVLNPGEHAYPERPSCVYYQDIRVENQQDIVDGIERPFQREEPLSPALLRRVRQGALDSDLVPRAVKDAVRASMG